LHRQLLALLSDGWTHGTATAVDIALLSHYYERHADHAVRIEQRIRFFDTGVAVPVGT
jgi:phosphate transport system protein